MIEYAEMIELYGENGRVGEWKKGRVGEGESRRVGEWATR